MSAEELDEWRKMPAYDKVQGFTYRLVDKPALLSYDFRFLLGPGPARGLKFFDGPGPIGFGP